MPNPGSQWLPTRGFPWEADRNAREYKQIGSSYRLHFLNAQKDVTPFLPNNSKLKKDPSDTTSLAQSPKSGDWQAGMTEKM
jgi:hypothetical protein